MSPDLQAQVSELQRAVSDIQRRLPSMPGNQLSFPLDPISVAVIKSVSSGGGGVSIGTVVSNAPGPIFPAGWGVSNPSTGLYTITHTLGTAAFVAFAIELGGPSVPNLFSKSSTQLTFQFFSLSAHPQNCDFVFAVFT